MVRGLHSFPTCSSDFNLLTLLFVEAAELLSSELLPRKIELEERYLAEALEILTSSQVR